MIVVHCCKHWRWYLSFSASFTDHHASQLMFIYNCEVIRDMYNCIYTPVVNIYLFCITSTIIMMILSNSNISLYTPSMVFTVARLCNWLIDCVFGWLIDCVINWLIQNFSGTTVLVTTETINRLPLPTAKSFQQSLFLFFC